jgi:2Fe-2S ferredoxin
MKPMPKIKFAKPIPEIEVECGAPLMASLLAAGLPVASSCHGDGICAKCRLQILEGHESLSPPNALETALRDRLRFPRTTRLSCQAAVLGDVCVDASYW